MPSHTALQTRLTVITTAVLSDSVCCNLQQTRTHVTAELRVFKIASVSFKLRSYNRWLSALSRCVVAYVKSSFGWVEKKLQYD